ncbi:hypothetical protein GN958_ATG05060 [Phytophthora infestans]|uniref:Uncharacterized protein n=1 Tax=Phytophthora infestans TaxID=4787 RepID=A0A8S9UZI1_PHYIN|nr:hypothetical protein GN958_ATG05060 [Phytophthora infestans]
MTTSKTADEILVVVDALNLEVVASYFDQDDNEIDPYVVCEGVIVTAFNKYVGDGEGLRIPLRFLALYDGRMVIVELPTKVHERTAREFESEFLTAAGNGREVAKGGSMTARRAANPNKEADATFGPKRSTLNRTPLPALRTVGNWATLAVEVGRSQTWTSLEAAAQWWCDYSGIQYILLLKVSRQGIQMRYALYDIAVLGTLPAPTASGTFRRRTTAQPAVNVSFDMRRILSIPSNAALPPDRSSSSTRTDGSQQEPPAGGGPKGSITEEDIRNAISDREIIDVTTPSDGEEAETEARTTLTTKKHTEYKEQEAEVEAMSDTSEPPRFDETTAEPLLFTEMYEYMRGEIKGMTLDQAQDVESSLKETLEFTEQAARAKPKATTNPWLEKLVIPSEKNMEDDEMNGRAKISTFRFLRSSYQPNEIEQLKKLCEDRFGFPDALRQPTEEEWKVVRGILEGTILCMANFPDFLKGVCTNEALRLIQNTIKAQVEGDLMYMLSSQFKVYPNFQSRKQLTNEFFMGIKNSANDPKRVAQMLQEAKQICYDQGHHTVHIICWTREMAIKWSKEFKTLSFRNRQFPLKNAHEEEEPLSQDNTQRTTQMWARQIGLDGIRNEKPQDRYHVRLMFISRFLDEAAIDANIKQKVSGIYITWQEPSDDNQTLQTYTWDIYFRSPHCPQFLEARTEHHLALPVEDMGTYERDVTAPMETGGSSTASK